MKESVFFEIEFVILIASSFLIPTGIYVFLLITQSISRWTVMGFAVVLLLLSALDVFLLQSLSDQSKATVSLLDDRLFSTELALALYLLPAVFAGVGVNLLSDILISHLKEAERRFDRQHAD